MSPVVYLAIIHEGWGEGTEVRGVFAAEQDASDAVAKLKADEGCLGRVERWEVKLPPAATPEQIAELLNDPQPEDLV